MLFLGSFTDDTAGASNPFLAFVGVASFILGISTEEEQLSEAFSGIGPFIAVGKPGEKLPERGAARMYVTNEEWQTRVSELMAGAQLVLLRAGDTEGFWWEAKCAAEVVEPARIVFLIPFGKKKYEQFRKRAEGLLPCRLPPLPRGRSLTLGSIRAMIYFEPDWTPRIVTLKARLSLSLNPLAPVLRKALVPIAAAKRKRMSSTTSRPILPSASHLSRSAGGSGNLFDSSQPREFGTQLPGRALSRRRRLSPCADLVAHGGTPESCDTGDARQPVRGA